MPRGKSRTQISRDLQQLVESFEVRKVALTLQIVDAVKEGLQSVVDDLNRRFKYLDSNLKKAKATLRKMRCQPTLNSMVAKPGDNTDKQVPGGIQGKGTMSQGISHNNQPGKIHDIEVD